MKQLPFIMRSSRRGRHRSRGPLARMESSEAGFYKKAARGKSSKEEAIWKKDTGCGGRHS